MTWNVSARTKLKRQRLRGGLRCQSFVPGTQPVQGFQAQVWGCFFWGTNFCLVRRLPGSGVVACGAGLWHQCLAETFMSLQRPQAHVWLALGLGLTLAFVLCLCSWCHTYLTMHTVAHRAAAAREAAEEAEAERWVGQLAVEGAGSAAETAAQLEVRAPPCCMEAGRKVP